jgi:integrase
MTAETTTKPGRKLPPIETDKHAQHVKADRRQQDFPVSGQPGLSLRVSADGTKVWTLRYRNASSQQKRLTIGAYPSISLRDARARARQTIAAIDGGADPAREKQERREAGTFRDVAENWFRRVCEKENSPARQYDVRLMLDKDVLPAIGDAKIDDVSRREIERLVDAVADRGAAVRANRVLTLTRTIFRWAVRREECQADPTVAVDKTGEEARDRVLSHAELRALWRALDTAPMSPGVVAMVRLAAATAQRIGEVAAIRRADIVLGGSSPMWTVPAGIAKNRREHRVPLSELAVSLLQQAGGLAGGEWLFPSPTSDGAVDAHAATRAVSRMRGKGVLGIENFRVHDLRRTAATNMGDMGFDDFTIGLVLNHTAAGITRRVYNRAGYDAPKRAALEAWGRKLSEVVGLREPAATNVISLASARG